MKFNNIAPGRLKLPLISILTIILLVIVSLVVFKTQVFINPTIKNIEIDASADILLNNFKHTSLTNGIKDWTLKAASAKIINAENSALLKDVLITIFTEDNNQVHITAPNGNLNTKTHDIELSGNTTIEFEGASLQTDKLHYKKKSHIIYSDGQVKITKDNSTIQADSLVLDLKDSVLELKGNIKGEFFETGNKG